MDNWLMLVIGVVVVVVIEVIAYRAYKRYRARKEARFTKESLGEVFGDMEATRAYLLRAKEFLKQCSKQAKEEGDEAVACLVDSLLAGERAQLEGLEELRQKLDAKAVEFQKKEYDFPTLADALESYAAEAAAWAYDTVPGMVQRARKEGYRDVAKQLRIIGEVEGGHADLARGAAQGQVRPRARSVAVPHVRRRVLRPQAGVLHHLQPTEFRNGANEAGRARLRGYNALIRARTGCGTHARRESEARSSRVVRGSVHP